MPQHSDLPFDVTRSILTMLRKCPWLLDLDGELMDLIEECDNKEERELIIELLQRFTYLNNEDFVKSMDKFVHQIIDEWNLEQSTTQVMATSIGSGADSAQYVLYGLKSIFQKKGWSNPKLVNTASKPARYIESHPNIVLVDEFIGTGGTIIKRVENLRRIAVQQGKSLSDVNIYICAVACTYSGKTQIENAGLTLFSSCFLKKGISDHFSGLQQTHRKQQMLRLESILTTESRDRKMHSFGYGECEALYLRENGNTPNNVFPIFWWPYKKGTDTPRNTILVRQMGDA